MRASFAPDRVPNWPPDVGTVVAVRELPRRCSGTLLPNDTDWKMSSVPPMPSTQRPIQPLFIRPAPAQARIQTSIESKWLRV